MTIQAPHEAITKALEVNQKISDLDDHRREMIQDRAVHLRRAVEESGLNPREIGEFFGVGRQRVYQMVEQGGLTMPALRGQA